MRQEEKHGHGVFLAGATPWALRSLDGRGLGDHPAGPRRRQVVTGWERGYCLPTGFTFQVISPGVSCVMTFLRI